MRLEQTAPPGIKHGTARHGVGGISWAAYLSRPSPDFVHRQTTLISSDWDPTVLFPGQPSWHLLQVVQVPIFRFCADSQLATPGLVLPTASEISGSSASGGLSASTVGGITGGILGCALIACFAALLYILRQRSHKLMNAVPETGGRLNQISTSEEDHKLMDAVPETGGRVNQNL
jgi:hypothetical protein